MALVNQQVHLHEGLKIKFIEGAKERKEIYNRMLELKGKLQVQYAYEAGKLKRFTDIAYLQET